MMPSAAPGIDWTTSPPCCPPRCAIFPVQQVEVKDAQRLLMLFAGRGADTSTSDIDLLVDFSPERSLYDLVGLQFDIESLLGRRADIVTEASLNALLRERILAEASPL